MSHTVCLFLFRDARHYDDTYDRAVACDFQQCGILTIVDSYEPVQPPFKLRNAKCCSVSSLTVILIQATSKGSDQTARMRRLV